MRQHLIIAIAVFLAALMTAGAYAVLDHACRGHGGHIQIAWTGKATCD